MKPNSVITAAIAFAFSTAAVLPATAASSTGAGSTGGTAAGVSRAADPNYSKSMEKLQRAAQSLREAVQAMAAQPAGKERNTAMEQARKALFDTQQAMMELPPELRTRSGKMSEADYSKSMEKLKQATQNLRDSAQAMATQPAGEGRNRAIQQVNEAILEANSAMVWLPTEQTAPSARR